MLTASKTMRSSVIHDSHPTWKLIVRGFTLFLVKQPLLSAEFEIGLYRNRLFQYELVCERYRQPII